MELKLQAPEKIKVSFEGTEYMVSKPRMGELIKFDEAKTELEKSGSSVTGLMLDFLDSLGLPKSVTLQLDPAGVEAVINALTPAKKN